MRDRVLNDNLMRSTMDYIRLHPEEWNQGTFGSMNENSPCGTTMCYAGTALKVAGYRIEVKDMDPDYSFTDRRYIRWYRPGTDQPVEPDQEAQRILGLTWDQAEEIFYASSGVEDPEELAGIIKEATGVEV